MNLAIQLADTTVSITSDNISFINCSKVYKGDIDACGIQTNFSSSKTEDEVLELCNKISDLVRELNSIEVNAKTK